MIKIKHLPVEYRIKDAKAWLIKTMNSIDESTVINATVSSIVLFLSSSLWDVTT